MKKIYQPHLSTAEDARAVRTREALRQALLKLVASKPFDQISIREIAATAGIGYTTFFRHHPSKESLLEDLAAEQMRSLISLVLPLMDSESETAASEALFAYVHEHRPLWSALLNGGAAATLRAELLKISHEIAAARPVPGLWPPMEIRALLAVSGTIELLAWWLRQPEPMSVKDITEVHHQIVVLPAIGNVSLQTLGSSLSGR